MRTFTAISPGRPTLPADLALLLAPIRATDTSAPGEYVGRSEGVLLDEQGAVVAFVVRLSPRIAIDSPRTLVSASAMTVTDDSVLHLSWSRARLLAQPWLDERLQPRDGAPGDGKAPPQAGVDQIEVLTDGIEGGAAGAVLGLLAGLALGGPVGAVALAGFFALGGGITGAIFGAAHETGAAAIGSIVEPKREGAGALALRRLEERLREPEVVLSGLVHATRFTPLGSIVEGPSASMSS